MEGDASTVSLKSNSPLAPYLTSARGRALHGYPLRLMKSATSPEEDIWMLAPLELRSEATSSILLACPSPDPKQPMYTLNSGFSWVHPSYFAPWGRFSEDLGLEYLDLSFGEQPRVRRKTRFHAGLGQEFQLAHTELGGDLGEEKPGVVVVRDYEPVDSDSYLRWKVASR